MDREEKNNLSDDDDDSSGGLILQGMFSLARLPLVFLMVASQYTSFVCFFSTRSSHAVPASAVKPKKHSVDFEWSALDQAHVAANVCLFLAWVHLFWNWLPSYRFMAFIAIVQTVAAGVIWLKTASFVKKPRDERASECVPAGASAAAGASRPVLRRRLTVFDVIQSQKVGLMFVTAPVHVYIGLLLAPCTGIPIFSPFPPDTLSFFVLY